MTEYEKRQLDQCNNKLLSLILPINQMPTFEWTGYPKPVYDDGKTIIFRTNDLKTIGDYQKRKNKGD